MTDMHLQATLGPLGGTDANGTSLAMRMSRQGGFYNAPISARFQEAVLRGKCFTFTAQTGIATQAGLSATTPAATLYNPTESGKRAVLWYAGVAFDEVFGTTGAIWLAANTVTTAAAVTGTLSTVHRNCLLGASDNPAINVLLAATLPAAPIAIGLLGMGFTGAITTIPYQHDIGHWYDGSIILGPNTAISIQTGVASGTAATFCSYIWEEIDI